MPSETGGKDSPAFRSAIGRSEREGMLSSTTSPAFRSAIGRSEREGMLSSTTSLIEPATVGQLDVGLYLSIINILINSYKYHSTYTMCVSIISNRIVKYNYLSKC